MRLNEDNIGMFEAAMVGDTDKLKSALLNGANSKLTNENGDTALMIAIKHRHPACAMMLINTGADTQLINSDNETALTLAIACMEQE